MGDVEQGMHFGIHAFVTNIRLHDLQELSNVFVENIHIFLELFLEKIATDGGFHEYHLTLMLLEDTITDHTHVYYEVNSI